MAQQPGAQQPDRLPIAARLPRPIAYVLGGGGAWGALQLGMLRALAETDLSPDLVVGTSVGALNGAILACDPASAVSRLDRMWPEVTRDQVFPGGWFRTLRTLTATKAWLYDNEPLTEYLLGGLPARDFKDLARPFVAVATDFQSGNLVALDRGELASALLASSAVPGVFPWVERDGLRLVDGGVVANVPISVAVARGARSLVVLDCGLLRASGRASDTLVEVLAQSAAIFARHQMARDLLACSAMPIIWLSRGKPNVTTQLDFSATATLIEEGYSSAAATLRGLHEVIALPAGLYGGTDVFGSDPQVQPMLREQPAGRSGPGPGSAGVP